MSNDKDITVSYDEAKRIKTEYLDPAVWTQMKGMAETFRQSGALPKSLDTVAKIVVVLQTGLELGLKPMESINSLYIVNGKVNFWGAAAVARLTGKGYEVQYESKDDQKDVTVTVKRIAASKDVYADEYKVTYTYEEAEKSGYTKGFGWKPGLNRKLKLRYGAISIVLKTHLPHLLGSAGIVEVEEDAVEELQVVEDTPSLPEKSALDNKPGSLSDFLEKAKQPKKKVVKAPASKPAETVDSSKSEPSEEETKPDPKYPHTLTEEWQKLRDEYFEKIRRYKVNHEDLKAVRDIDSINQLTETQIEGLIASIDTSYTESK